MFKSLLYFRRGAGAGTPWETIVRLADEGQAEARETVTFLAHVTRFAFRRDLERALRDGGEDLEALAAAGRYPAIVDALLDPDGLDYARRPKGLLKFHADGDGGRTAFEEHLVEAGLYARGADDLCQLHFTVPAGQDAAFDRLAGEAAARGIAGTARFEIDYSTQEDSTDTLSLDERGGPSRDESGRLKFRPGGHGALIRNLDAIRGDLVFVKNIDNVQPDRTKPVVSHWKRALGGLLVELQRELFGHLGKLREGGGAARDVERATRFARERLHIDPDGTRASALVSQLDRPLRVCGVVPNTGEPGGGPFWVRAADGRVSLQIVETGQVDPDDAEQQRRLRSSTHFNPVDLVCALRDARGRSHELARYVDPDAAMVSTKSDAGRNVRALELPGLWNGAMAHWNTVFVEQPVETFTPVKTVTDLLRPEHQPAS
jgi:hypothetical protein